MYPTIYHALLDLFGVDWPWAKLLNSFGFFVALAFIAGSTVMSNELRRKENEGLLLPGKRRFLAGAPVNWTDVVTNALLGFLIGWKFIFLIIHAGELFGPDSIPQQHIFSLEGSLFWGILLAALFAFWRWYEFYKNRLPVPEMREVPFHMWQHTGSITFMAAIGGVLGAKLFHLLENPDQFKSFLEFKDINDFLSGLTMYGGLIVGGILVLIYARRIKLPLLHLCDAAAPGLILAYGIGRIGCQVSGDGDWGIANTSTQPGWLSWLPAWTWSYDYPNNVNGIGIPIMPDSGVPLFEGYGRHLVPTVYPTPFYETVMCLVIFIILWKMRKKWKIPGQLFALYLIANGVERFFIEKIRVNEKMHAVGLTFTQAELISVLFFLGGILMWYLLKRNRSTTEPAPASEQQ